MDKILDYDDANLLFERKYNGSNQFHVYLEHPPKNISYGTHIGTNCVTTASTI